MPNIQLISDDICTDTAVPNCFIDEYMPAANGEFVKVYLYLLRNAKEHADDCTISAIADHFNQTEKDVLRALHYWQCHGLLTIKPDPESGTCVIKFLRPQPLSRDEEDEIPLAELLSGKNVQEETGATTRAATTERGAAFSNMPTENVNSVASAKATAATTVAGANIVANATADNVAPTPIQVVPRTYTADERASFQNDSIIKEIIFLAETYLKRTLSENDMNTVIFWHVDLKFEPELIDYLLQFSVSKGHTSIRYMDKIAQGWHEKGIETVEQAKQDAAIHSHDYYGVMKAMGITGRALVPKESAYLNKWTKDFGFDLPIIQNACERTISATHQSSFEYADSILSSWHEAGVHTLSDVEALDAAHQKEVATAKASDKVKRPTQPAKRNAFNNFNQRSYDYDKLEEVLLNTSLHG